MKKLMYFLVVNFVGFLVVEFLNAWWLHWWTYGSVWVWGEISFLGFSPVVYVGWLLWSSLMILLLRLCGVKVELQ